MGKGIDLLKTFRLDEADSLNLKLLSLVEDGLLDSDSVQAFEKIKDELSDVSLNQIAFLLHHLYTVLLTAGISSNVISFENILEKALAFEMAQRNE